MSGCFYHMHLPKHGAKHRRKSKSLEDLVETPQTPPPSPDAGTSPIITHQHSLDSSGMTLLTSNKFPGKLGKLFRSKSEQGLKAASPRGSPASSPKPAGERPQRRRLLRVVRDDKSEGEEWENPHVIRRYSKSYWEKQMAEAQLLQHSVSLPYDVNSQHTILKKTHQSGYNNSGSTDSDTESNTVSLNNGHNNRLSSSGTECGSGSPTTDKHCNFSDDVEVIEFIGKEKITKQVFYKHEAKLIDSDSEDAIAEEYRQTVEIITATEGGVTATTEVTDLRSMLKQERVDEFKKVRESLDSIQDEEEEEDTNCDSPVGVLSSGCSDTGTTSDASACSDEPEEPKKKHQKKKRSQLRVVAVKFLEFTSIRSDSSKTTHKMSKKLLGLHLQEEIDMTDSDSDSSRLQLISDSNGDSNSNRLQLIPEQ